MKRLLISLAACSSLLALNITPAPEAKRLDAANDQNYILSYNSAIAQAKKSVVNISAKVKAKNKLDELNDFFNDPFFKHFFGIAPEGNKIDKRLGSGVIISSDGYIITNNHLVEDAEEISVSIADEQYKAKVIGTDPKSDVALIKIEANNCQAINFADSDKVLEGDVVFAIGNPFGVGETITQGIVSALNKNNIGLNTYEDFIQTDASINPGNSGGALVDSRGALIGINSAIITRSGGANGIGFAIPSNMIKNIALQLAKNGKISRGYLGVYLADLTDDLKKTYKHQKGVIVTQVQANSAADKAGLKRGDLIFQADGKEVKNATELRNYVGLKSPNEKLVISIERDKNDSELQITLGSDANSVTSTNEIGLSLKDVESMKDNNLGILKGALVSQVSPNSKADKAGIKPGDVIIGVNSTDINKAADFNEAIKKANGQYTKIWLLRGGYTIVVVIK